MKNQFIFIYRARLEHPIFQNDELLQTWLCCNILATYNDSRLVGSEILNSGEIMPDLPLHFPYKKHIFALINMNELEKRGNNFFVTKFSKEQRSNEGNKVKFPKSIRNSIIWAKPELIRLYFYCYLMTTYQNSFINVQIGNNHTTIEQKTGTFISGRHSISKKLCVPPSTIRGRLKVLERHGLIILKPIHKNFTFISIVDYLTTHNKKTKPITHIYKSANKDKPEKNNIKKGQPEDNRRLNQRTTNELPMDIIKKNKEDKEIQKNKENKHIEKFDFLKDEDFKRIQLLTGLSKTEIESECQNYFKSNKSISESGFYNYLMQKRYS